MDITPTHLKRAHETWQRLAKEPITVDEIGGVIYAFGSELAMLRLEHEMRVGRARYSIPRTSWYYTTEKDF